MNEKYMHIFINFPRLGYFCWHTNEKKALKKLKKKIWKQIKRMPIYHFKQYCNIRLLDDIPEVLKL